jgi:hypothetical protein
LLLLNLGALSMLRDFSALLLFLFLLLVPSVWSQSAGDLAQKFPHHEVYEVEPGIVMSAKFASTGLVCEMRVEQTHFGKDDVVDVATGIDEDKINTLLDKLVPSSERGERAQDDLGGSIVIVGPGMVKTDRYANVDVQTMWGVATHKKSVTTRSGAVLEIKWRNRSCS